MADNSVRLSDVLSRKADLGGEDAVLPQRRRATPQAAHPVPATRRQPVRRGADGPGGLLQRLLAALPPAPAHRDRGGRGVPAAALVAPGEPAAQTPPPAYPQARQR